MHAMFCSPKAEELRAFIKDILGFHSTDVGDGWLIFTPERADLGCHPADDTAHEISFSCDDLDATMAELRAKGVRFTREVVDAGWGRITSFELPDGTTVDLYQPRYSPS
jgi:predicted enzyme related to lactoylglutathione lyase